MTCISYPYFNIISKWSTDYFYKRYKFSMAALHPVLKRNTRLIPLCILYSVMLFASRPFSLPIYLAHSLRISDTSQIRDTSQLFDFLGGLNSETIPDNTISVSFDIVNMYPTIDNDRGIVAVRNALVMRKNETP